VKVAITGVAGYFGRRIMERLERNNKVEKVVGISRRKYEHSFTKLDYHRMDVRSDKLEELFERNEVDAVVHLAFVLNPIHNKKEMRSIDIEGAKNVLEASKRAGVKKIIMTSSTTVYGTWADSPEFYTEESPVRPHPTYYYSRHKVEIEKMCNAFKEKNEDISLTIFRPCLVLGPKTEQFYSKLLHWPILPLVGGSNPEMQFVHEDDVGRAYEFFLMNRHEGVFNIVGEGTIKWKEVIETAGKRAVKMPDSVVYSLLKMLWALHLVETPPEILDFIKYRWVASGEKAKKAGFVPKYSSKEALLSFLKK